MRRLVTTLSVAALAAAAAATSTAATKPQLTPAGKEQFPDRAFVLTTGKPRSLNEDDVRVRENGQPISPIAVIPAGEAASRTFGTILVVDASNSMRGTAIVKAVAAARAFAAQRPGNQSLGLVTFNNRVREALQPTTDAEAIRSSLATRPPLAEGTYLYDAAVRAIDVLSASAITVPSVVLLTDGADTGSTASAADVGRAARAAGVRVFVVGLRSPQFKPAALQALAEKSGGTYTEAKSAASLEAVYRSLSAKLASEYLLRYRSSAGPAEKVIVDVDVADIPRTLRTTYR